jgi:hypothetical protein
MISKNIKLFLVSSLVCCVANTTFTACSPDEFEGADPAGLPTAGGADFQMTVDQETNQMVATYTPSAGTYPVWIIDGASYSTLQEVGYTNTEAGTHTIELRIGNRNGISQAGVKKSFTFNETKVDWSADFRRITGKEWRIDNKTPEHFGCGPAGTAGTEWWKAGVDEKKGLGIYDDRITFTAETSKGGLYSYSAGADGLTYVNYGTKFTEDYSKTAKNDTALVIGDQDAVWNFEVHDWTNADGEVISGQKFVRLAANTAFPYISSDLQYEEPLFRVEQLTASKMVLIYDNYTTAETPIAWRYVFTSAAAEKPFEGFDANSDFNLWKKATIEMGYYYAPGWAQIANPVMKEDGGSYLFALPEATTDRWQCQIAFNTDIAVSASNNYDFSVVLNSSKDVRAMVKLTQRDDDGNFFFADEVDLKAGEDFVFWKSNMPGIDAPQMKLVLDFGGNEAGTDVEVRNIVLKDHANDDGTVLPDQQGGGDEPVATVDWDYNSPANLWKAVDDGTLFDAFGYWFADNGWSQIPNDECVHNGDTYEITLPDGMGGSQWQGQFHIDTKLTASAAKAYNFYMVMEADNDCPGVTIKLTDSGDTNFFCEGRHDVKADEPFIFKLTGATLKEGVDATAIRLFFDFGGSPAGTHVKISKIYFEESVSMNYDDADNLWKAVDDGSMFDAFGYWFADNGWSQIPNSDCIHNGDTYEITLPDGMGGSQWQGQFHIDTKLTASGSKAYNFQLVLEADNDCPGVTIKLTDAGDTNFFCEGRHDIIADEPYVYTLKGATLKEGNDATAIRLFFDFGGSPAGTHVKISKIVFKEA